MKPLSEQEVKAIVKRVGQPRGKGHAKKSVDMELARAMLAEGFSLAQVAEYLGVSRATICRRRIARG